MNTNDLRDYEDVPDPELSPWLRCVAWAMFAVLMAGCVCLAVLG